MLVSTAMAADDTAFDSAKPIWLKGREKEMNLFVGFRATFDHPIKDEATLRIAAATVYRVWVNGEFLACGPARGPHGYYRIDSFDISKMLKPGKNLVAIEVAGYNSNSYALLDQPSFLQAEVVSNMKVLASTAGDGAPFAAQLLNSRVQKVQRYSFQRPFSEVYRLTPSFDRWRRDADASFASAETAVQTEKKLLPRRVQFSENTQHPPVKTLAKGRLEAFQPKDVFKDRSLTGISPALKGFPEKELATVPSVDAQKLKSIPTSTAEAPYVATTPISLKAKEYQNFDMGVNRTGFLGAKVSCTAKTRLWFEFDEILTNNDVDFCRMGCVNVISYDLEPGTYQIEAIEPYTLRYLKLVCVEGACSIENIYLREFAHPPVAATFASSDDRLNRIFAAAVETYRQNSLDIFMDCPSRERAGWLCDSFFTSRVARDLTGTTLVEHNFVENFLLPPKFEFLPDGMLPMCYPSDHNDGNYIPNWAMWFVLQLKEYQARSGDQATVDALKPKMMKLLDFFKKYENSDGLLEKLPSWVFVEWSAANNFVQDVNYPSNMLYAAVLDAAGQMYGMSDLATKAEKIRDTVRRQSFDGQFFVDNAVRKNGKLEVTRNRSEVCQYFAFFFKTATPESHAQLWATLLDKFGPKRVEQKGFPEVHPANSFVGNVLRMELLSQAGRSSQILDESIAYQLYMADRTGTLWENTTPTASCDHGFASHAAHVFYRDVLGVYSIDPVNHKVVIRFGDAKLDSCQGTLPTSDGPVHLEWKKANGKLTYHLDVPNGYEATIQNNSGFDVEAR
jgi:alpha-L-rhamnosidase